MKFGQFGAVLETWPSLIFFSCLRLRACDRACAKAAQKQAAAIRMAFMAAILPDPAVSAVWMRQC